MRKLPTKKPASPKAPTGRKATPKGKERRTAALNPHSPSTSSAPTGRQTAAQGKEQRDAALGPLPPQNPRPEGAAQSWETVAIGESLELINGRAFKPNEWTTSGRPIIRIQNLNNPKASFNYYAGELPSKFSVSHGDLLFAWSGTPGTSFGAHLWKGPEAWLNQHIFKVIFPAKSFDKSFLQLAINQNLAEYIGVAHGGAGLAHITKGKFEASFLPLPPLNEQRRIVAKIEEMFSEIDSGEESLRRARRQLGVYRQSLLKQAFEGKLTAQWRKQNPHLLEAPEQLLERIQAERQARYAKLLKDWEKTVEKWEAGAEDPPKPKKPRVTKDPSPIDSEALAGLPALTPEWEWTTLGEIADSSVGFAFKSKEFQQTGVRLLRGDNIEPRTLRWINAVHWSENDLDDYQDLLVQEGDIILAMDRPVISSGLKVAVARSQDVPCLLVQRVARIVGVPGIDNRFLLSLIDQQRFINHCLGKQTGTQLPHISEGQIRAYPVPLCSFPEQREIVRLLDEQFTVIEQNEREIDAALKRSAALRQSILKKAFTGQLVPQDPTDETASTLLERIRKEREALTAKPQKKKTARKRVTCQKT